MIITMNQRKIAVQFENVIKRGLLAFKKCLDGSKCAAMAFL